MKFVSVFQKWSLLLAVLSIVGCATTPEHPTLKLTSESDYYSALNKATQKDQEYSGFYNVLDLRLTFLSTDVKLRQVDQLARMYQWSNEQYGTEKNKAEKELQSQTDFFLSFFVPERKNNDLSKKQTLWRVFMDVNGRRLEGKVVRLKGIVLGELQALYPEHTRWSTPYKVTFPVSSQSVEGNPFKITLTGPVGSSVLEFN